MELDDAISRLGSYGTWQMSFFMLLSPLQATYSAFHLLSIVWLSHTPDHHCRLPAGASFNHSIPRDSNGKLSQCSMYLNSSLSNRTLPCPQGWTYDPNDSYTIVNKWDLVCDRSAWNQASQTILVVGMIFGAALCSFLSDRFGRKPVFLGSVVMMALGGSACALVPNLYVFLILRFICGMLHQGILLTGLVYISELFSTKQKGFAGILTNVFWGLGVALLAVLAYLIPNWMIFQLSISLVGLFGLPLFWILPESIQWLHANNQLEKAENVMRRVARVNKIELPEVIFINKSPKKSSEEEKEEEEEDEEGGYEKENRKLRFEKENTLMKVKNNPKSTTAYTIKDLFNNRILLSNLLVVSFAFLTITLVFYGLTFSSAALQGNRFLNGFIIGVIEIPACIVTYFMIDRFGRKKSLIALLSLAGLFVLLPVFVLDDKGDSSLLYYLPIAFSTIGKFCITGCFAITFLYSLELFPTNLRNQAVGLASIFGRIGNILATFTMFFMKLYPMVPSLLFAGMTFLVVFLVLLLPETSHRALPQTISEVESWTRTVKAVEPNSKKDLLVVLT